jgi:hypothetical protein
VPVRAGRSSDLGGAAHPTARRPRAGRHPRALAATVLLLAACLPGRDADAGAAATPAAVATPPIAARPPLRFGPAIFGSGPGRLPYVLPCPWPGLVPRGAAPGDPRRVALAVVEAADAPEPDAAELWELMDPSLRGIFRSPEGLARRIRAVPLDPRLPEPFVWPPAEKVPLDPRWPAVWFGRLDLYPALQIRCGEHHAARAIPALWEVPVTWRSSGGRPVGFAVLYLLARPDGPKLWGAYPVPATRHASPVGGGIDRRRLPLAYLPCPTGRLAPLRDVGALQRGASPSTVAAARAFLEAALAPRPRPRAMWALMDPSLRATFRSYPAFARRVATIPLDPEVAVWRVTGHRCCHPPEGEPYGLPDPGFEGLMARCDPQVILRLPGAWDVVTITWPRLADEGLSAGFTIMYFLGRPDGPRLWSVYH